MRTTSRPTQQTPGVTTSPSTATATATGKYFDNDAERFGPPHPDALDPVKSEALVRVLETLPNTA